MHSNECACRNIGRIGLEQVRYLYYIVPDSARYKIHGSNNIQTDISIRFIKVMMAVMSIVIAYSNKLGSSKINDVGQPD